MNNIFFIYPFSIPSNKVKYIPLSSLDRKSAFFYAPSILVAISARAWITLASASSPKIKDCTSSLPVVRNALYFPLISCYEVICCLRLKLLDHCNLCSVAFLRSSTSTSSRIPIVHSLVTSLHNDVGLVWARCQGNRDVFRMLLPTLSYINLTTDHIPWVYSLGSKPASW